MTELSAACWRDIVSSAPEGIVVCDATSPEHPVVYANPAFTQLSGYPLSGLLGRNLRLLQGADTEQEGRTRLREALQRGQPCRVLLRNYRADGSLFWNEIITQPVRDESGALVRWVSYHRDSRDLLRANERAAVPGLPTWMREDRMTGLYSRAYFEELLQRDWHVAQRDARQLCLTLLDIDDLGAYNEIFDKGSGDACIRRVARVLGGSYRRSGDLVARWDGGTFAVLAQADAAAKAHEYARLVLQRVRELLIHHPRATAPGRYVSVSAGSVTLVPSRDLQVAAFVNGCIAALQRAKRMGKNTICAAQPEDIRQ